MLPFIMVHNPFQQKGSLCISDLSVNKKGGEKKERKSDVLYKPKRFPLLLCTLTLSLALENYSVGQSGFLLLRY